MMGSLQKPFACCPASFPSAVLRQLTSKACRWGTTRVSFHPEICLRKGWTPRQTVLTCRCEAAASPAGPAPMTMTRPLGPTGSLADPPWGCCATSGRGVSGLEALALM